MYIMHSNVYTQCIYEKMLPNVYICIEMYIPNVYKCNPMYNTQCIYASIYIGDIHCVTFFGDLLYTLGDSIYIGVHVVFVTQCIYRIYIGTHVYTLGHNYIHLMTSIYIGYIHCVTPTMHIYIG